VHRQLGHIIKDLGLIREINFVVVERCTVAVVIACVIECKKKILRCNFLVR